MTGAPPTTPKPRRRGRAAAPWILAALSLTLNVVWALAVVPYDAPDEPSHLDAILQIRRGRLPEVHFRFDRDPRGEIASRPIDPAVVRSARGFGIQDPLRLQPYQSIHTPLYYGIVALVTLGLPLSSDPLGFLMAGRLVASACGAGTVVSCWLATRRLAPQEPLWAIAVASAAGLLPQFTFNAATASNDALVNCLCAAAFASWFHSLREPDYDRCMIRSATIVGLAILTKLNGLTLLPGLALVALFRVGQEPPGRLRWRRAAQMALGAGLALVVVCGWWFARNQIVYGDPTGSRDAARYFQARFIRLQIDSANDWKAVGETTWESLFGRFGWLNRHFPAWAYRVSGVATIILCGLTAARWARCSWRGGRPDRAVAQAWAVMAVVGAGLIALFVEVNFFSHGFQAQGRYFLPGVLPMALIVTGGLAWNGRGQTTRQVGLGLCALWLAWWQVQGLLLVRL